MNDRRFLGAVLGASLALVLASALRVSAQAQPVQAGVAAAVRGSVRVAEKPGSVGRDLTSGMPVYLGSEITTGPQAGLQIMLLDETVFTIGPESRLRVDEFVYDPRGGDGKLSATISKGVFRFVSGRIARKQPENMKVELPSGTIGIRGTSAMGSTDGTSASVVLLGPGASNNAGERPGRIQVSNAAGSVELRAPLFGTTIGAPGSAPSPAALWSAARLDALTGSLAAAPGSGDDKSGGSGGAEAAQSGEQSGEQGGEEQGSDEQAGEGPGGPPGGEQQADGERSGEIKDVTPGDGPGGDEGGAPPIGMSGASPSELAGQANIQTIQVLGSVPRDLPPALPPPNDLPPNPGVPTLSALTSFDQLRLLQTGVGVYEAMAVPLQGPGSGFYNVNFKIDFASQSIRLDRFDGAYQFNGEQPSFFVDDQQGLATVDYSGMFGPANNFSGGEDGGSIDALNGDLVRTFVEIVNAGNTIGGAARTQVVVTSSQTGAQLSGAAVAPQQIIPELPPPPPSTVVGGGGPGGPVVPGVPPGPGAP